MSYFEFLLLVHVLGAIIGFGPTFAFAVLGPLAGKEGGPAGLGIMKGMIAIEKRLVYPAAFVIQPLTGALLIFESGRDEGFFNHEWLWSGILLYAISFYLAVFVQTPALDEMVELAGKGEAGTPRFGALVAKTSKFGPILTLLLVAVIVLMVLKPGDF